MLKVPIKKSIIPTKRNKFHPRQEHKVNEKKDSFELLPKCEKPIVSPEMRSVTTPMRIMTLNALSFVSFSCFEVKSVKALS